MNNQSTMDLDEAFNPYLNEDEGKVLEAGHSNDTVASGVMQAT